MFGLKTHAIVSGALLVAIIAMAAIGGVLHDRGLLADSSTAQIAARVIFFALFVVFAFSLIPLMLKLFLAGQIAIGNGNVSIIRTVGAHQTAIVIGFWTFLLLGLAIAIPAALQDGFFGADMATTGANAPSQGTLVVRPGMSVDDMRKQSSLKIKGPPTSVFADGGVFDVTVAGTATTFARCRYYYITTFSDDHARVEMMSIGTSIRKVSRAELEQANAALRRRLAAEGWLAGHEVYRDEQDRRLHGGATRGPAGAVWRNGDTVLHILFRRMDDAKPGEDRTTAGEWIQFVDLGWRATWPGIERYVFEPALP